MNVIALIAFAIATLIPLAVLWFIRSRNLYQTGSFGLALGSFFWGAAVFAMVSLLNRTLLRLELVETLLLVQFIAPVTEEILKGLLFVYLFRKINFTYFVDGAIYGFAIGIGFAVFENYEYLLGYQEAALSIAIGRVISTNLIHASGTALVGIAFGLARFHKGLRRWAYILGGWLVAMILHVTFNNLVTRVSSGLLLLYAAAVGLFATVVIYRLIKTGLRQAREWIQEKLGAADRVTASEAQMVNSIQDAKELLAPLVELFGEQQAAQVQRFLLIQARLGIHRKNLDKLQDPALVEETKAEMARLRQEMDGLRRQVGTYTMMTLRGIFPPDEGPLWGQLEDTITARLQDPRPAPGGGIWGKLDSATQRPAEEPPE
ncbi:MAG: PrsW family intramembrane metalloprotease [Chloroflexi bacterium]|nr:PrsW family intramembrane metalloprotease [Chloroflexota bacterium]